jgi:hypothetical protein
VFVWAFLASFHHAFHYNFFLCQVHSEEEDQELNEGETNEKQEDDEKDEEEANKEMNFDGKEGLPKVVKAIILEQSQHGTLHDETSWDEIEKLIRSLWNIKDRAMLILEMEDSKPYW